MTLDTTIRALSRSENVNDLDLAEHLLRIRSTDPTLAKEIEQGLKTLTVVRSGQARSYRIVRGEHKLTRNG